MQGKSQTDYWRKILKLIFDLSATFRRFMRDDAGEVTIEWVLITAAIVSLSILVLTSIGGGTQVLAGAVDTEVSDREVSTSY